jgi:hypothetical protein
MEREKKKKNKKKNKETWINKKLKKLESRRHRVKSKKRISI